MIKIRVAILTVSTSCYKKEREDTSGKTLEKMCLEKGMDVIKRDLVPDNRKMIMRKLKYFGDRIKTDLVLTTGGTGLGPFDMTPEATQAVCGKAAHGISEMIRARGGKFTKRAFLSRGFAGIRKKTLIINLPGSPKGAGDSLSVILDIMPHAVAMLRGEGH